MTTTRRKTTRSLKPGGLFPGATIDREVLPLVDVLRAHPLFATLGSCCGHGERAAYVDLAVRGMEGARLLTNALNQADASVEDAWLEVTFNWSDEVATACDFDAFPDWLMLSLSIGSEDDPPTVEMLGAVAAAIGAALAQEAA